jgi:O-antigen ligase
MSPFTAPFLLGLLILCAALLGVILLLAALPKLRRWALAVVEELIIPSLTLRSLLGLLVFCVGLPAVVLLLVAFPGWGRWALAVAGRLDMPSFTIPSLLGMVVFCAGVPAVALSLEAFPEWRKWALAAMVFSTCHVRKPFYMEVFYVFYRGVDRGFGVTIPDLFFFGFALWLLVRRPWPLRYVPPGSLSWFLLVAVCTVSITQSAVPLYSLFTVHKLLRCYVLFWVMVNAVRNEEDVRFVLGACVAVLLFQGTVVFWDKYVTQKVVNRSMGSFNHPNALAMYLDLFLPVVWAATLDGVLGARARRFAFPAMGLATMAVVFTKSRAAIVLMPSMLAGVTVLSLLTRPTGRKMGMAALAALLGTGIFYLAMPRIIRRFRNAPKASAETREYFNEAAREMANDRVLGCGINMYSWALEHTDYYWYVYPDMLDLTDPEEFRETTQGRSRLGTAHNIYYLMLGETGWPGAVAWVLVCATFYLRAMWGCLTARATLPRALLLGMLCGFALLHVHGTLEWVVRQTQTLYAFLLLSGFMVALTRLPVAVAAARPLAGQTGAPAE